MGWLEGCVALVTGGTAGIGRAVVDRYVAEGARVAVLGRSEEKLRAVRDQHGDRVIALQGNVARYDDNARAVAETVAAFGKLDVFVGNAGVYDNRIALKDLAPDDLDRAFDELFATNVKGYLYGAK